MRRDDEAALTRGEVKITPAMRRLLLFIHQGVIVSRFPAPFSLSTLRKLRDAGLVEHCGKEPGPLGLTQYRVTDAGRASLPSEGAAHIMTQQPISLSDHEGRACAREETDDERRARFIASYEEEARMWDRCGCPETAKGWRARAEHLRTTKERP